MTIKKIRAQSTAPNKIVSMQHSAFPRFSFHYNKRKGNLHEQMFLSDGFRPLSVLLLLRYNRINHISN